jgi:FtsP/CotA-like multicopper oxidase with cupredoxin domain
MTGIETLADQILRPDRRRLLAGLGAAAIASRFLPPPVAAQTQPGLALHAKIDPQSEYPVKPDVLTWLVNGAPQEASHFTAGGDSLEFTLSNDLPVPVALNWRGLDGISAAEPLAARAPLAAAKTEAVQIKLRQPGTFLCDLRLTGDGQARCSRALPLIVRESEAVSADRDQICLFEDWRLRADGTAIAPGSDPKDGTAVYTINGQPTLDIPARVNERLRIRFINGFQRTVIAVKIENQDVRVMAMDSQPAEPFPARNGAVVLAPGARVDAFVDASTASGLASRILLHDGQQTHTLGRLLIEEGPPARATPLPPAPPLPSNGLPDRLDLKNALRVDLALGGPQGADWVAPAGFASTSAPAFRTKAGRTVVLALTNRANIATVFHLHGHHFRLLDRLDDGWKPFWLDTLAIEPGTTQRVAFAAEHVGHWLIESVAADWTAPRLVRWYGVE